MNDAATDDDVPEEFTTLALNPKYLRAMGLFQSAWAGVEVNTDFAICKFLGVTYEQAHLITAGMMFGRKSELLVSLIKSSDESNKAAILSAFDKVRVGNKRNLFAHGYIATDRNTVTFIQRPAGKAHEFTLEAFEEHVSTFATAGRAFTEILDIKDQELENFVHAAFPEDAK
jgi:hypothetical protein